MRAVQDTLDDDDGSTSVEFSAGNPRVQHITGLVHLYRPTPGPLINPAGPSQALQSTQTLPVRVCSSIASLPACLSILLSVSGIRCPGGVGDPMA